MLYVQNQDTALAFWTEKVGFEVISEENNGQGMRWIEIAPTKMAETSIILHDKELIAKMSPAINLQTPSLMFYSDDLETLYNRFIEKQITVGDIVPMPTGSVFNFADDEGNYFAVMQK